MNKSRRRKRIILLAVIASALLLLFPRIYALKDGGTTVFESIGHGAIYQVKKLNTLIPGGYRTGVVIDVFGNRIYDNSQDIIYTDKNLPTHNQETYSDTAVDYNGISADPHDTAQEGS